MLSVLNQTYENMEYIIIDGGSIDGTKEIIEKHLSQYSFHAAHTQAFPSKLKWFSSEPDKGIYDAMNKGLAHAEGDWVSFINAGDTYADESVLEDIFSGKTVGKNVCVVAGNTINVLQDKEEIYSPAQPEALEREMLCSHQALFVRFSPEDPWRFNTRFRIAADYNLLHSIYKTYGAKAFYIVKRNVARYDCTDSFSIKSVRAAKKEYLRIQKAWTKLWWWKEWLRVLK